MTWAWPSLRALLSRSYSFQMDREEKTYPLSTWGVGGILKMCGLTPTLPVPKAEDQLTVVLVTQKQMPAGLLSSPQQGKGRLFGQGLVDQWGWCVAWFVGRVLELELE